MKMSISPLKIYFSLVNCGLHDWYKVDIFGYVASRHSDLCVCFLRKSRAGTECIAICIKEELEGEDIGGWKVILHPT